MAEELRRLVAVELDIVEGIVSHMLANVVNGSIDEDSDALALCGQISGRLADIAA